MPLTGECAWKEVGLNPEERIDRFFNLIDHAVEGGVALSALYSRVYVKEFLLYTLRQLDAGSKTRSSTRNQDQTMAKLTLTSLFASTITIGDPGVLAFNLLPKETKSVEATETQIRQLTPGLEKLKSVGWINYTVSDGGPAVAAPKPALVPEPPQAPEPKPEPVPEAKLEPKPEPAVENKPEPTPEPTVPAQETPAAKEEQAAPLTEAAPSSSATSAVETSEVSEKPVVEAPAPSSKFSKNRNR